MKKFANSFLVILLFFSFVIVDSSKEISTYNDLLVEICENYEENMAEENDTKETYHLFANLFAFKKDSLKSIYPLAGILPDYYTPPLKKPPKTSTL